MKKNLKVGMITGIIALVIAALVGVTIWQSSAEKRKEPELTDYVSYELSEIKALAKLNDYDGLDATKIIAANALSGGLPENVEGSEKAPVVLIEYADYQCSYCAAINPLLNKLVEEFNGEVAIVMRSYVLSYHPNGVAGAAAANAAAIQGYWAKYKDLLFSNQNDWFYSKEEELQEQLEGYFKQVTNGKGDLEKFRADMASEAVKEKIAFDYGLGEAAELGGTPWIMLDGEWIDHESMGPTDYTAKIKGVIEAKLAK